MPGAFLTDHGTVAGFAPFAKAMGERDLFYGFGMEAYQAKVSRKTKPDPVEKLVKNKNGKEVKRKSTPRDQAHLILLAKNEVGLRNLMCIADESGRSGYYYVPRVDWELLEKFNEGVICTSACMSGLVADGLKPYWDDADGKPSTEALSRYMDIFGDDFFIELHTYSDPKQEVLNLKLCELAQERGIPLVYANDAHYACADDHMKHEVMLSMQQGKSLFEDKGDYASHKDRMSWHPNDLYIMGEGDVRERLSYLPKRIVDESISNSDLIASKCDARLPEKKMHLPVFKPREEVINNEVYLLDLIEAGLKKRYGKSIPEEVIEQAIYEYTAITEAGLGDYFLIVWDLIQWCRHQKIKVGPGRGSVGGSVMAYALEITQVDPFKFGLYFERFWNPGRADGLPDIDIDIQRSRRPEAKQYLKNRYGELRVLSIGNHIRMRPKQAIDKVGVAFWGKGHSKYGLLQIIKNLIETLNDAGKQPSWDKIWDDDEVSLALQKFCDEDEEIETLLQTAEAMTGRIATYGIHASAIVISDVDLPQYLPCRMATPKDDSGEDGEKVPVTQLEMDGVEDAGFPKFDVLGLKTLDVLDITAQLAGDSDFDFDAVDYDAIPEGEGFWELMDNAITLGLFQIEDGHAARKISKDLKPRSLEDLGAIVALNRPGPLRGGVVDRYIVRRDGKEPVEYAHPILEDILRESHGDFLYQEGVIAYFRAIGYDLGEADYIRGILGKKKVKLMEAEYPRYLERACNFMPKTKAEAIWKSIEEFSKYSFNKSHSVEYGLILAQTMYAKWQWPTEFIMASIMVISEGNATKRKEKIAAFIEEARKMDIPVLPPDINHSDTAICKVDDTIYFGLRDVKFVGDMACDWVKENRPFKSYEHFLEVHAEAQEAHEDLPKDKRPKKSPRQQCSSKAIDCLYNAGAFDAVSPRDISIAEICSLQEELMGIMLSDPDSDLADKYADRIKNLRKLSELEKASKAMSVPGVVTNVKKVTIREDANWVQMRGREMAIIDIRWAGESMSFAAFPDELKTYSNSLRRGRFCKFTIKPGKKGFSLKEAHTIET